MLGTQASNATAERALTIRKQSAKMAARDHALRLKAEAADKKRQEMWRTMGGLDAELQQVADWLETHRLGDYKGIFAGNRIRVFQLKTLTNDQLSESLGFNTATKKGKADLVKFRKAAESLI